MLLLLLVTKGFEDGNNQCLFFFFFNKAVEKDSDLKCENVNQRSLDPSEVYHLGTKHIAIYNIGNAVAFDFKSPSGYNFS